MKIKMEHVKFKPFRDTYKLISFTMCVGMLYPNPRTEVWRMAAIPIVVLTSAPLAIMIFIDIYFSWLQRDFINIIRHSTVIGPFLGGFLKMIIMNWKRVEARQIIDEFDRDYETSNHLPQTYKKITSTSIKNSLIFCERSWVIIVTTCVMIFPSMAITLNTYNYLFKSDPEKYMIHDLNKPFCSPESRFESPYFEIIFVYMFYCSILYVINFIGYDGFFGLSINHACLKMELYCKLLEDAMLSDAIEIHQRIVHVIIEQNRLFEYVQWIQDTFNVWLGVILIATMIQICTCMYHITEGYGFDLRYMIFVIGAVIHIFLPCRYAAKLKAASAETATKIYCCGWERVNSESVRKIILFMIARAQMPMEITAFNMLAFDMELFVSIMQSSYSMFTLLRSSK